SLRRFNNSSRSDPEPLPFDSSATSASTCRYCPASVPSARTSSVSCIADARWSRNASSARSRSPDAAESMRDMQDPQSRPILVGSDVQVPVAPDCVALDVGGPKVLVLVAAAQRARHNVVKGRRERVARHVPLQRLQAAQSARPAIALVNPMPLDGINPSSPPVAGPRRWRGTTTPPLRLPLRHSRAASSAAAPTLVAAIAVDLTPA